ncbi:MAG: PKD domain-containing protein, partial [Firmicutes bacterium]|nr:PKD domain-containing protein [Bacillota bacterium]
MHMNRLLRYGLGILMVTLLVMLSAVYAPPEASAATTSLTIKKLASDKRTVLEERTVTYQELEAGELNDGTSIQVTGDGNTRYYHQGPVFVDNPDEATQEMLRWNEAEDTNWDTKDMGALKGTNVKDLCNLVGGMVPGDTLRIKATDGLAKTFDYKNVYEYTDREGPMVVCWYKDGKYPDSGYSDGMRLVWFAEATYKEGPTSIAGLPSGDYHVFGNWDWHEAADSEYWYYYMQGTEKYPTTTGLSVQYVSELTIYSNEPASSAPVAAFTADVTSGTAPLMVSFTDQSTGTAPLTYAWDFDNDGTVDSTDQNPSYQYTEAGTYSVKLTVTNATGSDDEAKIGYITVSPAPVAPVAAFTADVTSGTVPLTVQFTDQSTNSPTSWAWDFDNDGTVDSTAQNPTHQYSTAGAYTVKLTVSNSAGSDDETKTDYITVTTPEPQTWYVDDSGGADFTTIQAAVTAARAGDTIIVKDGAYTENVVVEKSLVIKSENGAAQTIVQAAANTGDVFKVTAANVTIDGFTASGATTTGKSGITISGSSSSSCTVINNECSGNSQGISIQAGAKDNTVADNTVVSSGRYG